MGQAYARAELHGSFCYALDVRKDTLYSLVLSYFLDKLLYLFILPACFIVHSLPRPSDTDG